MCKGFDILKIVKTPLIQTVSYFNVGGFGVLFGELSPPKPSCGDGSDAEIKKG